VRRFAAPALVAALAVAAGCGGNGGGGSIPEGAGKAPADTAAFISLATDPSSEQWKQAMELAARFPGAASQLRRLDKYKGAYGPELDVVWLDFANNGDNVVAVTKPSDIGRLKAVIAPDKAAYSELSGGWVAIGGNRAIVDRFAKEAQGDKLDGDKDFKKGFGKLEADSAVRAWVRGSLVQSALDRELASGGAAPRITHLLGDLHAISASARAANDGAAADFYGVIDPVPDPATFSPTLAKEVPSGALLYFSTTSLDTPLRILLRMVGESSSTFDRQLQQVQSVLGISLEDDIYPLLKGESAVAIYAGRRIPPVLFLQKVDDESKAEGILRRLSAIAQLSGEVRTGTIELRGETVQKLTFKSAGVTIYDGVARGKIFVTNAIALAGQAISGPAKSLADDELFLAARKAAGLPDQVAAFAYGDLQHGLPFVFRLAEQSGSVVPPAARANTKPLHASLAYLVKDADGLRISGFVTIK
jgi:hypothetical protein